MTLVQLIMYAVIGAGAVSSVWWYAVALIRAEAHNYDCPNCGTLGMMHTATRMCKRCGHQP